MNFCEVSFGDFVSVAEGLVSGENFCHIHLEIFS